uniref:hypothetical protein n=1 Tax=Thaumasiovibrio occultus TaxID=1891184 RepID=UPI00131C687A|nr:hypothetical protein [Thaumasiovibrio occultus]
MTCSDVTVFSFPAPAVSLLGRNARPFPHVITNMEVNTPIALDVAIVWSWPLVRAAL